MMIMRRREGEKILIGDNIVIEIAHISRNRVKIAIEAPREIAIEAEELQRVRAENAAAAQSEPAELLGILTRLQPQTAG